MANGKRSSDRAEDEENGNGRPRRNGENGKTNSCSSVSDSTGVRRSPREKLAKKITPSTSSTEKSKQLQTRTPPSPAVNRKSERVEKQNMPTPLRRSGRTRSPSSLSPSDSKSSASMSSKQRPKKEKSVKQLTFEAKEVNENEEHDSETAQVKVPRMDARRYRAMFRKPNNDCLGRLNKTDKLTQEFGNNDEGKIDEGSKGSHFNGKEVLKNGMLPSEDDKAKKMTADSRLSGTVESLVENNLTIGSFLPSNATTSETSLVPQRVQPDSCVDKTLKKLESRNSLLDENLARNSVGHDSCENLIPSKRNGPMTDMVSDISATLANNDDCNLIPSRLGDHIVGTGGSCSKRRRLDCDPTVSCLNESCNPSATEDGGDIDASMLQKECPANSLTEVAKNICLICKSEGKLLFCGGKGCNGSYHISCLEPPLVDAPVGVWHCRSCVRKKIEFGVYSVSEGIELVCDANEVPFSNVDGFSAQNFFLVKYKGLAHAHNRWIQEDQLLIEAPSLLIKFNMKDQTRRLKPEWSLPHRLLQKRALICPTLHDDNKINHAVDNFDCCYEWLVKWRGLGYEHVTWELDSASFLRSPEGQSLIRGYEERFQRAKRVSSCSKLDKKTVLGSSVSKLCQMPGGVSSGVGNINLDAVNKLREHWYKGQNAIVIDDHERFLKVVAFILSLHSDTYRPFLIISTAASLHSWEDEFYHLDPSIDVVIYSGNKEIRNSIRRLEFHDGGGCILFQVLIVVPETLIEDIDVLGGIQWEAIIIDECQSPKVSSYLKKFKILNTHLWVLLSRGQLKDSIVDYYNILPLLDCQSNYEKDGLIPNSSNSIDQLKEILSSHIAYRCKSDSFRFVEYWVPVQISHVQLEQYCATLHSKASILRSSSKTDTVEALRDVLSTTRKCCSHPCTVDPSLNRYLPSGAEAAERLNADIKASGKLQLLDSLLEELKNKKLRGLVLFQPIGVSGLVPIGDVLEDFLRHRFGLDSYERVDKGLLSKKKEDAMRKFNNKDDGRFVFLLETCACRPNIKLSSVDAIIIFDSDLNPMNDIRSLQKITLDSQFELIKIFRLYSSFTIEENALILAKQNKTLDINLQNINWSTCHRLLMWGASSLFDHLRLFHDGETSMSSSTSLSRQQLLDEAVNEFSSILSQDGEDNDTSSCLILSRAQQNGVTYRSNFSLLGEQRLRLLDEEPPHTFWTKLLEGKQFQWKYPHSSSQRSRKRVNHSDGLVNKDGLVSEGIAKKRRKVSHNIIDLPSSKPEGLKLSTGIKTGTSVDPADRPQLNEVRPEKQTRLLDEQRSLHLLPKPEITKLYEVLLLPDNVKSIADSFLEYVTHNHHVSRESLSISQAFQLSLSWTAATLLKHKLDHKASLALAKQHLNFVCKKEEVEYMYSLLRCLKRIFWYRTENSNDTGCPKASESSKRVYSSAKGAREVELFKNDVSKSINEIGKKCEKQRMKLSHMNEEEKQRLQRAFEDEKAVLEKKYKIEVAVIRSFSPNDVMSSEQLKMLHSAYSKKFEEQKHQHETRLKNLEEKQSAVMHKFKVVEDTWVEEVQSWANHELLNIVASEELGTGVEHSQNHDQGQPQHGLKNVGLVSDCLTEGKGRDNTVEALTTTGTGVPEINSPAVVLCSKPVELQVPLVKHTAADEMSNMASEDRPVSEGEGHGIAEDQNVNQGSLIPEHSHSGKKNFVGAKTLTDEGGDDTVTLVLPSSNGELCDGETSDVPSREAALDGTMPSMSGCEFLPEVNANSFSNGTKNTASLNSLSPEKHIPSVIAMSLPDCQNTAQVHDADECNVSNIAITEDSPLSDERIVDGAIVSLSDREAPLGIPSTVNVTDCPENVTAVNPPPSVEEGALNEVVDRELSRPCGIPTPSDSLDTSTPLNPPLVQPVADGVSLSTPDGNFLVMMPEDSHEVADGHNDIQPVADAVLVDRSTISHHQEEVPRTVQILHNSPDTTTLLNPPLVQQVSGGVSLSTPARDIPVTMPEDSHEVADGHNDIQPVTNAVLVDRSTISHHQEEVPRTVMECTLSQETPVSRVVDVMDPPEQVQQLSTVEVPPDRDTAGEAEKASEQVELVSSPVDVVQANQSNELSLTMEPPEQVQQLPSLELPSSSQSPSNLLSVTGVEHQPIQTATHSAYRMPPPLSTDPLKNELERIRIEQEQLKKKHDDTKSLLKSDYLKDLDELRRKYDIKFQESEVRFQQTHKNLDTCFRTVAANKILADAFRSKCKDRKAPVACEMRQDGSSSQLLPQFARQQSAIRPSKVSSPSSRGPPAASLQSPSTPASSQNMLPPIRGTLGILSSFNARRPHVNSLSSPLGNSQVGGEIRAPAPHLQPYRPSTSMPAPSFPALPPGMMSSRHAPNNNSATSPSLSHGPPQPKPMVHQSGPHLGHRADTAGGFPALNSMDLRLNANSQPAINLPNVVTGMSDVAASLHPSRSGASSSVPANPSNQATSAALVCLSDDD